MSGIPEKNSDITHPDVPKKHTLTIPELFFYLKKEKNMYAKVLSKFQHSEDSTISTMAVGLAENGKISFSYNPTWFQTECTADLAKRVIEHECLHITENHIPRYLKFERNLSAEQRSHLKNFNNIAADEAVNSRIGVHNLTPDCINPHFYGHPTGKSLEKYMTLWLERTTYSDKDLVANGLAPHKWIEDISKLPDDEKERLERNLTLQTRRVIQQIHTEYSATPKNKRGQLPGYFHELFKTLPKVSALPWETIFNQHIQASVNTREERNSSKINRRLASVGISPFPGKRQVPSYTILFAVDTSGSMSTPDLMKGLSTVSNIMATCPDIECTVLEFDTTVHRTYDLKGGSHQPKTNIYGRGGTDFNAAFIWLKERETNYDLVIVFTDGYAPDPERQYLPNNMSVIWLLTPGNRLPFNGNYGTPIIRN